MIDPHAAAGPDDDVLVTIFGRLFESQLGTLERLVVSCRTPDGMRTLDERRALAHLLGERDAAGPLEPDDPIAQLHRAMLAAFPEHLAVVSGPALHLRDLLVAGMDLPEPTSMLRKRGVTRLQDHLVDAPSMDGAELDRTLARARETASANAMKHVLVVVSDGFVHVAGRSPEEAMAHWSNVEFSARVECQRIEERLAHGRAEAGG